MALTEEQIADFRADIGDQVGAFSPDEIQRLYVRAHNSYEATLVLGIEQLLANAAKFNDYSMNQSEEDANQIFENLKDLLAIKKANLAASKSSVRLIRLAKPQHRGDKPHA